MPTALRGHVDSSRTRHFSAVKAVACSLKPDACFRIPSCAGSEMRQCALSEELLKNKMICEARGEERLEADGATGGIHPKPTTCRRSGSRSSKRETCGHMMWHGRETGHNSGDLRSHGVARSGDRPQQRVCPESTHAWHRRLQAAAFLMDGPRRRA